VTKRDLRHVALYARVSTRRQDLRSQEPELRRWAEAYAGDEAIVWYTDKESGTTMQRPAWQRVETALRSGDVARIVVWRLDRLGRTAAGLTALFAELRERGVPLVSVREGFDLMTPAGHLVATILASVAQFETEVRRDRVAAGIAAARAAGKRWGGRAKGQRYKVTAELERQVKQLRAGGETVSAIARALRLSRPTVYATL